MRAPVLATGRAFSSQRARAAAGCLARAHASIKIRRAHRVPERILVLERLPPAPEAKKIFKLPER